VALSPRLVPRLLRSAVVTAAAYYALWGGTYSAFDLRRLREAQAEEQAKLGAAKSRVDSLQALAARLESDPATLERVARERFGMIRDGELLYRFVEVDPPPSAP
jgi:cell division protein FtsB